MAQWLEMLSAFDFTVCHCSGKEHMNADALSCRPCPQCGMNGPNQQLEEQNTCATEVAMIESTNWMPTVQLQQHHQSDPDLSQMITWLKTDTLPSSFPHQVSRCLQTLWLQQQQLILQNDGIMWKERTRKPHPNPKPLEKLRIVDGGPFFLHDPNDVLYWQWEDVTHGGAHSGRLQVILSVVTLASGIDLARYNSNSHVV